MHAKITDEIATRFVDSNLDALCFIIRQIIIDFYELRYSRKGFEDTVLRGIIDYLFSDVRFAVYENIRNI